MDLGAFWFLGTHFHSENKIFTDLSIPRIFTISFPFLEKSKNFIADSMQIEPEIVVAHFRKTCDIFVQKGAGGAPLPKNDVKSWVGYRNQIKHLASSVTKPLSFTRANLVWLEPFLRFSPSLVGHFQMHTLGH